MKVAIFNVKFSENLGDGLLSECMTRALHEHGVDTEVIDIAGRSSVGTTSRRSLILKTLKRLPPFARRLVVKLALKRMLQRNVPDWREKIAKADGIILGGGNLFQDDDLNFPLKVGAILDLAVETQKPLSIFAVGVTPHWSRNARTLFGKYQDANLHHLSFRDELAQQNWQRHFRGAANGTLTPDPGLLVGRYFAKRKPIENHVGICVTAPEILIRHATQPASSIPFSAVASYVELIRHLAGMGLRVTLFTNGAREDNRFAEEIFLECQMSQAAGSAELTLAPRPESVEKLVEMIAGHSTVIAHRLHACICAHSLGIPSIGLAWDSKVQGFFDSTGREDFCVKDNLVSLRTITEMVERSLREKIDQRILLGHVSETLERLVNAADFPPPLQVSERSAANLPKRIAHPGTQPVIT